MVKNSNDKGVSPGAKAANNPKDIPLVKGTVGPLMVVTMQLEHRRQE